MSESTIPHQRSLTGYAFVRRLIACAEIGAEVTLPQREGKDSVGPFLLRIIDDELSVPHQSSRPIDPTVRFTCLDPESQTPLYDGSFAATAAPLLETLVLMPHDVSSAPRQAS